MTRVLLVGLILAICYFATVQYLDILHRESLIERVERAQERMKKIDPNQ